MSAQVAQPEQAAPTHDPVIGALLSPALAQAVQARRAAYVAKLLRHDWSYEYSDCGASYERGRSERIDLLNDRAVIDPDCSLWNKHAPAEYRVAAEPTRAAA